METQPLTDIHAAPVPSPPPAAAAPSPGKAGDDTRLTYKRQRHMESTLDMGTHHDLDPSEGTTKPDKEKKVTKVEKAHARKFTDSENEAGLEFWGS